MAATPADTILHPVRMRIVSTLTGRRLTTQQIGAALPEVAQATLYRHIGVLFRAEVIEAVEERRVRGVVEKVYALAGSGAPITLDTSGMGPQDWKRGFAAYAASLLGQFETYIGQPHADPVADGVTFRTAAVYLTDEERMTFYQELGALILPAVTQAASREGRRSLFSFVLIPDIEIDIDPAGGHAPESGKTQ